MESFFGIFFIAAPFVRVVVVSSFLRVPPEAQTVSPGEFGQLAANFLTRCGIAP
jgi:hypothetical protein